VVHLSPIQPQKYLYTETIDGYTWFWPTTARVGNYTRVPDAKAAEVRGGFARLGYRFVPLTEARQNLFA
jgi:hypothetical protein